MDIKAAGSNTISVSDSAICMGRLSVVVPAPFTPRSESGELEARAASPMEPKRTPVKRFRNRVFNVFPDCL